MLVMMMIAPSSFTNYNFFILEAQVTSDRTVYGPNQGPRPDDQRRR